MYSMRCRLESNALGFLKCSESQALLPIWSSKLRARRGAKQPNKTPPRMGEADLFLINKCCEKKTNSPTWGLTRGENRIAGDTKTKCSQTFSEAKAQTSQKEAGLGPDLYGRAGVRQTSGLINQKQP